MMFQSAGLLVKHKAKFCVGSEVPELRGQRHGSQIVQRNNGRGIDPRQTRTADLVQVSKPAGNIQTGSLTREGEFNYLHLKVYCMIPPIVICAANADLMQWRLFKLAKLP